MTATILEECFRSIVRSRPELNPDKLRRTRETIEEAFGDLFIDGYEALIDGLALPDPDDRHVLAAAIHGGIPVILTFNLRDFPGAALRAHGVVALHPGAFLLTCVSESPESVVAVVQARAEALRSPPTTPGRLLELLSDQGLPCTVAAIRRHLG